jgi:phosphatidylethanolamine/phosphatidyl-N-methylethanolamine N-methyltransferase
MTQASNGSGLREHLLFLGRFLRSPRTIGAIAPSSKALAAAMVEPLDCRNASRVVELGPGTGSFTAALIDCLSGSSKLLAIDREAAFVERLRARWPQADFVCASAADLPALAAERHFLPIDHIVSGLPFASLPGEVTKAILDGIERSLRPGGTFTTFQYVHAYGLPPAVAFRRDINTRMGSPPTRSLVLRNIPPAYVLTWRKRTTGEVRDDVRQ